MLDVKCTPTTFRVFYYKPTPHLEFFLKIAVNIVVIFSNTKTIYTKLSKSKIMTLQTQPLVVVLKKVPIYSKK